MTVSHVAGDALLGGERRTTGLWTHNGKLVVKSALELQPPVAPSNGVASLVLPDGSIGTAALAPGACQQLIGSYAQPVSWTLPQANVWTETPISMTVTFSGVLVRVEFNVPLVCATKGQHVSWGIMLDGAVPVQVLGALDSPENSFGMMAVGAYYTTLVASTRRVAWGLKGPSGSTIPNGFPSTLYITEQRR